MHMLITTVYTCTFLISINNFAATDFRELVMNVQPSHLVSSYELNYRSHENLTQKFPIHEDLHTKYGTVIVFSHIWKRTEYMDTASTQLHSNYICVKY